MPIILFERRFWEPVETGQKVHTIRLQRKRPVNPGDSLILRGWEGAAYRSPQRHLLDVTCLAVRLITVARPGIVLNGTMVRDIPSLDDFAKSDGFAHWEEMLDFTHFNRQLPFSGVLIQWGEHPLIERILGR